ncbi:MAG: hypothetical protein IPP40_07980 [bacterium]|nr:hypothetical protein [bacterium]
MEASLDNNKSTVKFVPYQQKMKVRAKALAQVEFSLKGLSENDIQVLGHLSDAVDLLNPIYRDQFEPQTPKIEHLLTSLLKAASPAQAETISNYVTILNLQNSPFSLLPRKNHLLALTKDEVKELVKKAGGGVLGS